MGKLSDKELLERIMADTDFEKDVAKIISAQINEELGKKKPDYNKIAELSEQYSYIVSADEEIESRSEQHIQQILSTAKQKKPKFSIRMKVFSALTACAVLVFTANIITVYALDMNIFKAVVKYTGNGFSVDFVSDSSDPDPYGIKAECEKYGIYPQVPTYLPKGFEKPEIEHKNFDSFQVVNFRFQNDNMSIGIYYNLFDNLEDMSKVGFPSDYFNIEHIEINGRPAITSKEDNQFTLVYAKDNLLMSIFTVDVPYSECDKIVESMCR